MKTSPRARLPDRQGFLRLADWLAVGVALSLPWSTSATSVLIVVWFLAWLPTLDVNALRREVASAAGGLPVLLWALGALGMLGAAVSWGERFEGLGSFHRLLAIPLLLAQFHGSDRGMLVLRGFLVSATCLLATSWGLCADRRHDTGKVPWGAGQGLHIPEWHFSYLRLRAHRRGLRLLARREEGDPRCARAARGAVHRRYRFRRGEPHRAPRCPAPRHRARLPAVRREGRTRRGSCCRRARRCAVA
jgi:hypothetical protein